MEMERQQHSRTPQANDPKRDRNSGQRSMGHIEANSRAEGQEDSRRRTISFSSEEPYRRWFGMEILDHAENALDLSRLNDVGVLLFNHDTDKVVGKVIRAWVENHRGMAEVEFDTDDDAEKIFGKVKSGTLKTTSVRYSVDSWEEVVAGKTSTDGRFTGPCQIARKWTPLEVSIVSVPADATVGVGTTTSLLRMSKDDLWNEACRQFFNPTAAFPAILDNAIRKNIVQMYQEIPTTFQLWTTKGSVSDFKPTKDHSYLAGGAGEFLRVGENGELKADTPKTELLPQRQIDTFGRQFSMTRQAFINDDVGFITEMPGLYAMSAKRTINKQVYKILIDNPAIFDGVSLFDNAHNNLIASGAAPSIDTLQAAMLTLLHQKDPFGDSIMVEPKYVIVPVGYGFKLAQILETAQIDVTGIGSHTANALYQYRNKLQVIEEGALNVLAGDGNAIPWFVAGDQRYAKSLQVDYLNGQETPTIRRSEVPGRLGFVWDIWLDWGITAVDFRGIAKNPGTTI